MAAAGACPRPAPFPPPRATATPPARDRNDRPAGPFFQKRRVPFRFHPFEASLDPQDCAVHVDHDPAALLNGVSFFRNLPSETLEAVASRMVLRHAPAGTILFRKGEDARGIYVLVRGRVEIFRSTSHGREQVLHTEEPVRSVAELPLFDGGEYPASGRTPVDSELYFLSRDDFHRLYREYPEIADAVIRNLGQRLRALVGVVDKISLRSVPSRVARTLLEVADRSGALTDGGDFRLNRTQAEIAQGLATTRESVARALGELRRRGVIRTEGRRVRILSLRELEDVARGEERSQES